MADLKPIPYPDAKIRSILEWVNTIARVGASPNWNRQEFHARKAHCSAGNSCDEILLELLPRPLDTNVPVHLEVTGVTLAVRGQVLPE